MKLLLEATQAKAKREELERVEVRARLRRVLAELLPGQACWIYGSLTQPGRFQEWSDVDLAVDHLPAGGPSLYAWTSLLGERIGRRVDLVLLGETRLREKILQEGERWIG